MSYLAFLLAALALALTPGPGLAYVVARTLSGGRAQGLASCVGTAVGGLVHVLAAALGLSLLIAQSAAAFAVLKLVGVVFLLYLGIRLLLRRPAATSCAPVTSSGWRRAFVDGMVVEATNVKTALFFLAFLPQFAAPHASMATQMVLLGSLCVALNTLVDVVAVLAAHRLVGQQTRGTHIAQWVTRGCGITLIGLAGVLALARRQG